MSENGIISRINGPIVDVKNLAGAGMYEVVEVGREKLIGEVIRVLGDRTTVQTYEDTAGLKPGDPVERTGAPLSVYLGPGLLGNIYDGIQRPLADISALTGVYLKRGQKVPPLPIEKLWPVKVLAHKGDRVGAGQIIATVQETELVEHRIMTPPDVSGEVVEAAEDGQYPISQVICRVKTDGGDAREVTMVQVWPARRPRPTRGRLGFDMPLVTGQRIIDTFFPLGRGGAAAIPGGFGTGKTMTQHALAKWSDAQIIVYIGCGERGNEMTDVLTEFPKLIDPRTGRPLMERTVLVANTSNMPVAAREVSIYTGITIAEYFRDMGYDVAVMADSTSRWAEALRELAGRLEEMPAEEGFPAYLATRLAQFYERAGRFTTLGGASSSVSVIGAVSPPGGDFAEPVTQHTRRFIRCFWALDSALAYARHYPAINWLTSYSEYTGDVTAWWNEIDPDWSSMRTEALDLLQRENRLQQIVKLVGADVLPESQRLILFAAEVIKTGFLQQSAFDKVDMFSSPQKQAKLLRAMLTFSRRATHLVSRGVPLAQIRALPSIQAMVRAKSTVPNDQPEKLDELARTMAQDMDRLEREFAK